MLLALLPAPGFTVPPATGSFQVAGAIAKPASYSASALRGQFKSSLRLIAYTRRGVKHTAHAVPLWTVLQAVGPRVNSQIKNHALQFVVLVSGSDGYTAAFSFGELSPTFGNKPAWLAVDEDGQPTRAGVGSSVGLVVPDDVKAGRWVHSIQRVSVVDEAGRG